MILINEPNARYTEPGRADPDPQRNVALHPLDAGGELWQGLTRLQDETGRFVLDKRQAIVAGIGMLSGPVWSDSFAEATVLKKTHDLKMLHHDADLLR